MKTKFSTIFTIALLLICQVSFSQSFDGLWGVVSVKAGNRTVTPVAKWFLIKKDGTFKSGNGWSQNTVGTWSYDQSTGKFAGHATNGIRDEYGAFNLKLDNEQLIWDRVEDGMTVIVVLERIAEIPAAPADLVQGLWSLSSVKKGNEEVLSAIDPQSKQFIHIRPDKRFRLRNPDETSTTGFWHMNGHQPLFTLIDDNRSVDNLVFSVEFFDDQLIMKHNEQDLQYTYQRIFDFPN